MNSWSRKVWTSNRRQIPRYRVDGLDELKGNIESGDQMRKRLCTFSRGGCGFYVDFQPAQSGLIQRFLDSYVLRAGQKVPLFFELMDHAGALNKIHALGTIRYSTKVDDEDPFSPWYFGIEFDAESRYKLASVMHYLEDLAAHQKIEED